VFRDKFNVSTFSVKSFQSDKSNLLGSGAFGKVYKGKIKRQSIISNSSASSESADNQNQQPEELHSSSPIIHKDIVVAIKTCGSDVDVLYFKALLSEVKIMAFIGHNKNVCICSIHMHSFVCFCFFCRLSILSVHAQDTSESVIIITRIIMIRDIFKKMNDCR
jgi:serine/threonine protein kinase